MEARGAKAGQRDAIGNRRRSKRGKRTTDVSLQKRPGSVLFEADPRAVNEQTELPERRNVGRIRVVEAEIKLELDVRVARGDPRRGRPPVRIRGTARIRETNVVLEPFREI